MSGRWTGIVDRLGHREDGTSIALFRIAVGLTIWGELLLTWLRGADVFLWYPRSVGGFRGALSDHHWLLAQIGVDPSTVSAVFWITTLASLLVALGLGTRLAAAVALVGVQALFSLSPGAGGGHDRMFTIALFTLVLARSDGTLSARCWLANRSWTSAELVPAWPRVLITWNLTLVYVSAGLVKLSAEWLPSGGMRAVYNMLLTPYWARADWSAWVGPLFPLTQVGTVVTVFWETTWFVVPLWLFLHSRERTGIWARVAAVDLRSVYVAIGFVMHGSLWVLTNLGPFSAITLSWYLMLYRPDELKAAARWVQALPQRLRRRAPLP